jgi:hypothetical protein
MLVPPWALYGLANVFIFLDSKIISRSLMSLEYFGSLRQVSFESV